MPPMSGVLPYQIAVLCYLYDEAGRLLLLHRVRPPNKDLYSPIGGKLHMEAGESPLSCALREIREEVDLDLAPADLHLTGLITETGFNDQTHWLMFLYEVRRPVTVQRMQFGEGRLEWHTFEDIQKLPIPETDRTVIYPLLKRFHDRFFHAHIDCRNGACHWRLEHPTDE
jgi:8-oxo-dGTP diphosphatase